MIEGSLGLFVEGLVSILLIATIFYCISVNRKLERLRDEQKGMHSFIRELSAATTNADKAIQGLRATVQDSGTELAGQIDKGRNMSRLIKSEIEQAEQTINKLIVLTGSARNAAEPLGSSANGVSVQNHEPSSTVDDLRRSMMGFEDLDFESVPANSQHSDRLVAKAKGVI